MDAPSKKQPEHDDPMELRGVECGGDPGFMIDCLVEEYARLGWPPQQIVRLFESPLYPVLHNLWRAQGPDAIRARIEKVVRRCGVFRVRTVEPAPAAELVEIDPAPEGG